MYLSGPIAGGIIDYAEQHCSLFCGVAVLDDPDLAGMIGEALPAPPDPAQTDGSVRMSPQINNVQPAATDGSRIFWNLS
jgi:hypothetical protein